MTSISREDFAQSVEVAITAVRDFYKQLSLMSAQLWEEMPAEPNGLKLLAWRMPSYPKHGDGLGVQGLGIHDDYVSVWQPKTLDDIDDEDGEYDESDDGDVEEDKNPKRKKRPPIEFMQSQQLLAIRIMLRHPRKPDNFEPCLLYTAVGDWGIGDADWQPPSNEIIRIDNRRLRWIARVLNNDINEKQIYRASYKRAVTTGKGKMKGRLNCTITTPVQNCSLYDLDTPQAVEQLIRNMKALFSPVSETQATDDTDD